MRTLTLLVAVLLGPAFIALSCSEALKQDIKRDTLPVLEQCVAPNGLRVLEQMEVCKLSEDPETCATTSGVAEVVNFLGCLWRVHNANKCTPESCPFHVADAAAKKAAP